MMVLYAKIEPPPNGATAPFRVTQATQWEAEASAWAVVAKMDPQRRDILMVYFPECKHQMAVDFLAGIHHSPILMEVMTALQKDGILWKMWSLEHGQIGAGQGDTVWDAAYAEAYPGVFTMPGVGKPNDQDHKFLKALRIKRDDEKTKDQSGLHLVQPGDGEEQDPSH